MNLDTKNLPPEVAAYIRSLEEKNRQLDFFNEAEVCSDASAPEPGKTTSVKRMPGKPSEPRKS